MYEILTTQSNKISQPITLNIAKILKILALSGNKKLLTKILNLKHLKTTDPVTLDNIDMVTQKPIMLACEFNQNEFLSEILYICQSVNNNFGLDLNLQDDNFNSPLMVAAFYGFEEVASNLFKNGAKSTIADKTGVTPLHLAAANLTGDSKTKSDNDLIGLLIQHGSRVGAKDFQGNQPIHYAAVYGSPKTMQDLIKAGAPVNASNASGQTPLHLAIQFQRENIVNILLNNEDIDFNLPDEDELTPLTAAFVSKQYKILALMLMQTKRNQDKNNHNGSMFDPNDLLHFASNNCPDLIVFIVELLNAIGWKITTESTAGGTVLHSAVKNNDAKTLAVLLSKDDSIVNSQATLPDPDNCWQKGDTALHVAARTNAIDCIPILNKYRCPPNLLNDDKLSALHLAVKFNHLEAIQALFEATVVKTKVNIQSDDKTTPLHIAAYNGHKEAAEYLLVEQRANVHSQDNNGWTPLHHAAENNQVDLINLLIEFESNIDCRAKNTDTPLHVAVINDKFDAVDTFLRAGALVNARGEKNFTPLHKAAQLGYDSICDSLIKNGARLDHRAENKNTPLHTAAAAGKVDALKVILVHNNISNLDLNKSGFNGWNAFHQAAIGGHTEAMQFLLDHGCRLNQEDDYSLDTALHLAARFGQEKSIEFLVDQDNIRLNVLNKENKTPLDLCRLKGHDLSERFLLESEAKTSQEMKMIKNMNTIGINRK